MIRFGSHLKRNANKLPGFSGGGARGLAAMGILALSQSPHTQAAWFQRTAPPPTEAGAIVMAQAYLDQILLGPGVIDGRVGTFTEQAVSLFNQRHKVEPGNWWRLLRDAQRTVGTPFTRYKVREQDLKFVGHLPEEPMHQQQVACMVYRSLAEFVAERYHTTEKFLAEINPGVPLDSLRAGTELQVPNVVPFKIEDVPERQAFGPLDSFKDRLAQVDARTKSLKVFDRGRLIACFPVTLGEERFIPYGDWNVVVMVTTPEFRWDKQMLEQGKRSEEFYKLPPGPNNPVGILWAGLNKSGIGLHGTSSPGKIGRSQSAGCIRLANWDAIRLPALIRPGTRVLVR